MMYGRSLAAHINRLGQRYDVLVRSETGENDFGNPTDEYTKDREILAVRTYPNRNTTMEGTAGDAVRDQPVFIVPKGEQHPAPPSPEDHLMYDGVEYELGSPTHYDSHAVFYGEMVRHPEAGGT